jgi:hypothetical protein
MVIENTEQAKELIQGWMDSRGFFDPVASPSTILDGFHFVIAGKAENEIPFYVLQPTDLNEAIKVIANVMLGKEHLDAFNDLEANDREQLLWNLQRDIIFTPTTYSFNPEYKKDGTFNGVQFTKEISYDELTKGMLSDAVIEVTKCVLWVIWTFKRRFGPLKE